MGSQEPGEAGAPFPGAPWSGSADLAEGGAPMNGGRRACPRANLRRFLYRHKQHSGKVGSLPQRPPPSPAPHPTQAWGTVGLLRGPNCLPRSPPPQLSHASCFAPPSGKKAAGHPVPTLTLHASQRESAHCTAGKHLCHLPQRPLRG